LHIRFEPKGAAPLYKELADTLYNAIVSGEIAHGEKLPTVRQLAEELGLAAGTVKKAFEELTDRKAVRTVQGSGTFAHWQELPNASRKERAVEAIGALLDELEDLGFSPREISMYLELMLRERLERGARLRLALVDCNAEAMAMFTDQLTELADVDVFPCVLQEAAMSLIPEECDLVITTETHITELKKQISIDENKLLCLVAEVSGDSIAALARLPAEKKLAVVAHSRRFTELMLRDCGRYRTGGELSGVCLLGEGDALRSLLAGADALLLPEGYRRFASHEVLMAINDFGRSHPVLRYEYRIDRGSCLRLLETVQNINESK